LPRPIEVLAGLQKIDLVLRAMEDEEREIEKKIASLAEERERIRLGMEGIEKESEEIRSAVRETDRRISQANERKSKSEEKIRAVSGTRELKALNKEVNIAGKIIRQAEREANELRGRLTEQGVIMEARQLDIERLTAEIEALEAELSEKKAAWNDDAKDRHAEREALSAKIPEAMRRLYETISAKRGGRAVVPLRGEACQGCYMHVPPQTYVRLKRGDEEIIRCPHCERILYVEDPATTEAPGAS